MNSVDRTLLLLLNSLAQRSWVLDNFASLLSRNMFLKGGVFVFLFWWLWFSNAPEQTRRRQFLILGLLVPFVAVVAARVVAHVVPFRERPLRDATLNFHMPLGGQDSVLQGWSSFPSDHAAFFFALSMVFFLVSKRAGVFAILYAGLLVCLSRVYLGLHYPSDVLAGALIGTATASVTLFSKLREAVTRPVLRCLDEDPARSYGCLFLLTYIVGTVGEPVLEVLRFFAAASFRHAGEVFVPFGRQSIEDAFSAMVATGAVIAGLYIVGRRAKGLWNA